MQDSKLLHFLKQFPAWIVLLGLTVFFVVLYYISGDAAFKEWTALILTSLFTALGMQRQPTQAPAGPTTNVENVETVNQSPVPTDAEIDQQFENIKQGE